MTVVAIPRLCGAEYLRDYKILATFEDGKAGVIDLEHELWGEEFEPLREVGLFRRFRFDAELDTIVWPTGADLAPEYLYENAVAGELRPVVESPVGQPFFPVSKVRVRATDTGHTFRRHWAVVSDDRREVFAIVTEDYQLVSNLRAYEIGRRAFALVFGDDAAVRLKLFQRHHAGHAVVGAHRPDRGRPRVRADRQGPLASVPAGDKQLQPQPRARVHRRGLPMDLHQRHDLRRAIAQAEGHARNGRGPRTPSRRGVRAPAVRRGRMQGQAREADAAFGPTGTIPGGDAGDPRCEAAGRTSAERRAPRRMVAPAALPARSGRKVPQGTSAATRTRWSTPHRSTPATRRHP